MSFLIFIVAQCSFSFQDDHKEEDVKKETDSREECRKEISREEKEGERTLAPGAQASGAARACEPKPS